jgi:hypothetical protein
MSMIKGSIGTRPRLINKIKYCILHFRVVAFYLAFIIVLFSVYK